MCPPYYDSQTPCSSTPHFLIEDMRNWYAINSTDYYANKHSTTPVTYCISETVKAVCGFHVNTVVIFAVIGCNIGKLIGVAFVAYGSLGGEPLTTMGDALDSFLRKPDRATAGMCLLSRSDLTKFRAKHKYPLYRTWRAQKRLWFTAVSEVRLVVTFLM